MEHDSFLCHFDVGRIDIPGTGAPTFDFWINGDDCRIPSDDICIPPNDICIPSGDIWVPSGDIAIFGSDNWTPSRDEASPSGHFVFKDVLIDYFSFSTTLFNK